jgi:hypothetical protein
MVKRVGNLQGLLRQLNQAALAVRMRWQQQHLVELGVWVVCQPGTWAIISIRATI